MSVDQEILDGVGAAAASYTDITTGTSSLSGYSFVSKYNDEDPGNPALGLQLVVYVSSDHSNIIVSFVGTNEGKDAIGDLDLAWDQFHNTANQTAINNAISNALTTYPDAEVTFAGHSAGGIIAQYAAYNYEATVDTGHDTVVNLVTNNSPGATDVLAAQAGVTTAAIASVASNFGYVANTYEQDDIVHLMGSAYVGSTTDGAQTLAIVTPDAYDPITAHLKDTSLGDLAQINDGTTGYSLVADTPENFQISDEAAALTSAALAQDADIIPRLDQPSAYAYAIGQFLSIAGTLGEEGQTDGVREFLNAYIDQNMAHILSESGGASFLESAGFNAQFFAVEKLEDWATEAPTSLYYYGEFVKDDVAAMYYVGEGASYVAAAITSASEAAYGDVMAAAKATVFAPATILDSLFPWDTAPAETSPLVIDLSSGHTGITLTTFDASTTTTSFDLDSTGFAEQTAWVTGTTGLLVEDLNSNGVIDNGNELFGSPTVDGFAKLAALDSNHDLKIDSSDADWSLLQVWIDSNGNGVTDSGELHSLSSLGIVSIDLAGVAPSTAVVDGNPLSHTSTVTFSDGSTSEIADAWFQHSTVNTYYNGTYSLDDDTLFMPDLRGYGTLPELAIAMSQDSTLKGLVSDYVGSFDTSGFASTTLDSDVASILYEWAGIGSVDPSSRGPNVDAQHLEFLEHLFGQDFVQTVSGSANPDVNAGADIEQSWNQVFTNFEAQILLQAGASNLFASPVTYDPVAGTVDGNLSLSESGIMALDTNAPSPGSSNVAYWENVAHFLDTIKGLDNLTTDENTWMNSAVSASDSSLTWDDVKNDLSTDVPGSYYGGTSGDDTLTGSAGDDTIAGNGGNDTINAGDGNDTIYVSGTGNSVVHGGYGNDIINVSGSGNNILYGEYGNDTIYGGSGNDTIEGGSGGNLLYGGSGNTTYVFGGGNDVITESGGTDQITLPSGITSSDLTFTRVETGTTGYFNDLLITVDGGAGGSIQITNQFAGSGYQVETLVFSDSSTINLTALSTTDYTINLSPGDDTYSPGLNTDQVVNGGDGNDAITTGSGDDTLNGGNGNDILTGGTGNDTYIASPGFDKISDAGGTDTIQIPTGYSIDDVTFSRHIGTYGPDNDLIIDIRGLGEIQVENQFYSSTYAVENLYFVDGSSTVSLADQTIQTIGTSGNDTLYGVTSGVAGNWFDGRGGNDTIINGIGDNTYVFAAGFGTDTISSTYHSGTNILELTGIDPSHIRMWTDAYGSLHLQDTTDTSHSITVSAAVTGSGTAESAIGSYLQEITFDPSYSTTWSLTGGLHLTGDNSGDSLYGTAYGDTITGGTGSDYLYGNGGDDTIISGGGTDYMYGGAGNDTFVFSSGFGSSYVTDNANGSASNTIHLTGINPVDIRLWTDSSGYLHIQDTTNPSYNITVYAGTTGSGTCESTIGTYFSEITFDPSYSTTWSLTSGLHITADNSGDSLYGTAYGDTITGGTGNDYLYGNGGADTLISGGGTDYMYGGAGNDTFVFSSGFGSSYVTDNADGSASNTIHFTGIDPADIRMWTDYSGSLHLEDTTNPSYSITVYAGTTGSGTYESTIGTYFSAITFDSSYGTTWSLTSGLHITGDNSGESLYGTAYGDTITGGTGNDYLYGNGGDDTLIGGGGGDYMYGGAGNDTFVFSSGFGSSYVTDNANGSASNVIHLTGIDPADIKMWTDYSGSLHIEDTTHPSYNITVYAGTTGSGTYESTIGTYFSEITFDSSYGTTWNLTGGLTLTAPDGGGSLYGTGNGDTLNGTSGGDTIYANAGNNQIYGAGGYGSIYLGTGADTVLFKGATAETGVDTIYNFDTAKSDKIDISDVISTYDPLTMDIANFVELTTSGSNTQLKVDTDGSGTSYTQIATLSGVTGLNLSDLISDGNLIVHHA